MTATDALAGAGLFAIYVAVSALLQRAVPSWSPALIQNRPVPVLWGLRDFASHSSFHQADGDWQMAP